MRRTEGASSHIGGYVLCKMVTVGVPPKAVATKSKVHESTISRLVNGVKEVSLIQLFEIGCAIGYAEGKAENRKAA